MALPQGPQRTARDGTNNRMRIRAFPQNNVDERFMNDIWSLLRNIIMEILRGKSNSELGVSVEELYRIAYTMVLHKHGARLYDGLKEVLVEHLNNKIREDVLKSLNDNFLSTLNQVWSDYTTSLVLIRDILMYMDRVYVNQNNVANVYNLGLMLFRDHVLHYGQVRDKLCDTLLDSIARERCGETIDPSSIKNACQMLMQLGMRERDVYEKDFERPFLQQSADYYKVEAQNFLMQNAAAGYVQKVEQRLHEEMDRVKRYLDSSTEGHIIRVVEEELIIKQLHTVVAMEAGGVGFCIENKSYEDMASMFKLFNRVPERMDTMLQYIGNHLADQGKDLVTEEEAVAKDPVVFISSLLTRKDDYDKFLEKSFDNDPRFSSMISNAFEKFLNMNPRSPEYLSLFINDKLIKGNEDVTEQELENVLDRATMLFQFLQQKDVFERFCEQQLAERLLCSCSASDESEKMMIEKLSRNVALSSRRSWKEWLRVENSSNKCSEGLRINVTEVCEQKNL